MAGDEVRDTHDELTEELSEQAATPSTDADVVIPIDPAVAASVLSGGLIVYPDAARSPPAEESESFPADEPQSPAADEPGHDAGE